MFYYKVYESKNKHSLVSINVDESLYNNETSFFVELRKKVLLRLDYKKVVLWSPSETDCSKFKYLINYDAHYTEEEIWNNTFNYAQSEPNQFKKNNSLKVITINDKSSVLFDDTIIGFESVIQNIPQFKTRLRTEEDSVSIAYYFSAFKKGGGRSSTSYNIKYMFFDKNNKEQFITNSISSEDFKHPPTYRYFSSLWLSPCCAGLCLLPFILLFLLYI